MSSLAKVRDGSNPEVRYLRGARVHHQETEQPCEGCGIEVVESLNMIRRTDGDGNWYSFCSEDCYAEWCERQAWLYERVRRELNIAFRRVQDLADEAEAVSEGKHDDEIMPNAHDEKERSRLRYPSRCGKIRGILSSIIDAIGKPCIGQRGLFRPTNPAVRRRGGAA